MKIGIDARFWGIEHTGIGRYVMELIRNLEKIDQENEYILFLRKKYFNRLKFNNNFVSRLADYPHYSFSEQVGFKRALEKEALDLVHFPHFNLPVFYRKPFVVTIHDLIKHESRGSLTTTRSPILYWFKYLGYLVNITHAVKRAHKVIVPSQWWQKRLQKRFRVSPKKIIVTYESVSENIRSQFRITAPQHAKQVLEKHGIKKPFVVYTGNLYPHKNVLRLVEAIKDINQKQCLLLVIICAKSVFWQRFKKEIDRLGAGDLVVLAGFVTDKEMAALYQEAEAFVFPSLLEGFGLPGLEAMALGLPVVCSQSSCLPEVYQEAAVYFNPRKPADISRKIRKVINDPQLKKKLVNAGHQQVKKYSWEKLAKETLAVYKSISKKF